MLKPDENRTYAAAPDQKVPVWPAERLAALATTARRRLPRPLRALGKMLLGLALCVVLTMFMGNADTWVTESWDNYSEMLVFGRMLQMQLGQRTPGGFLGVYTAEWGDVQARYDFIDGTAHPAQEFHSYVHQSGLQGFLWGEGNKALGLFGLSGTQRMFGLRFLCCMLYYAVTLLLCAVLHRRLGVLPAVGWGLAALLAPGIQTGMKNLYWNLWLWWLPLLAGCLLCRLAPAVWRGGAAKPQSRARLACGLAAVFAACLARCLCGFEYISTFLILCETPLVFQWATEFSGGRNAHRAWLWRMVQTAVAALGGVAAALGVWLLQGRAYYGNWAESFANVAGAAGARMSVSDAAVREGVSVGSVLQKYLVQDATILWQLGPLQLTVRGVFGVVLGALALSVGLWYLLGRRTLARQLCVGPAVLAFGLSVAAPLSWMVLSKAHADIHTWLTPMLWQFALVPAGGALLGLLAAGWWKIVRRQAEKTE